MSEDNIKVHTGVLYPVVRVRSKKSGGSGTVIWSDEVDGDYNTFVLTNHHVIKDLITVEDKYNAFVQRHIPAETRGTAHVERFRYQRGSRIEGTFSVTADIVAYDEKQDIALLKLRTPNEADYVAKLAPVGREKEIKLLDRVYAVGAALGHPPIVTAGRINYMDDEIEDYEYWLSDAQIIFGNSGGAVFLQDSHEFIGIPSRLDVAQIGWSLDPITHMGYFVPFPRIWDWLKDQYFHFIIDDSVTYQQCEEERNKAQDEARRMVDILSAQRSSLGSDKD